ncbi:sialic acid-binding Ig-like lectin 14 [Carettochelys insculpta]|uniref:sialic acid-binding Ig-like lectin 14 n=1 Tax=Carettochelys insculpta TaxID=44489 RepID=UPI003EB844C2
MWVQGASQLCPSTRQFLEIILALLCPGWLCQGSVYQIHVPPSVTVQQGLCVLLPCRFTADFSSSGPPYKYWLLKDADRDSSPAVATTNPNRCLLEPGGRFRLVGNSWDDCSLSISDVQARDMDRYYFRFEKGQFKYSYLETQPLVNVTGGARDPGELSSTERGRTQRGESCGLTLRGLSAGESYRLATSCGKESYWLTM